jgi:branched-chain amino acid transport system substrate-binding protein
MQKKLIIFLFILITVLIIVLLNAYKKTDILIGFSGQLTGVNSDLGVQGRNGVILAAEEINSRGGIANRKIRIIPKDDGNTPEKARKADMELIDSGVTAIIGHVTSSQTIAALPVAEKTKTVLLSPTASTPELSGKKDMFFRVQASLNLPSKALARFAFSKLGLETISTIRDTNNNNYTDPYNNNFTEVFRKKGGKIVSEHIFSSEVPNSWLNTCKTLKNESEGVLIIASARITALLTQCIKKDKNIQVLTSNWAATPSLILHGGKAVEGIYLAKIGNSDNPGQKNKAFLKKYKDRFGSSPSFAAIQGYIALNVLAKALKKTGGNKTGLPEALTKIKDFNTLHGKISIDQFGDAVLPANISTVRNRKIIKVSDIKSGKK